MISMYLKKDNIILFFISIFLGLLCVYFDFIIPVVLISLVVFISSFYFFEKALLLLIFYLPFQIALNIAPGFDVASGRVFILALFFVWFLESLRKKKVIINFSIQTILILLFLFLSTVSIYYSFELDRAIRKILVLYSIFPLYFIITSYKYRAKEIVNRILPYLFFGVFVLSCISMVQFILQFYLGVDAVMNFFAKYVAPIFYGETFGSQVVSNPSWLVNISGVTLLRTFSIFPDPHIFSFYLGMIIPLVFSVIYFQYYSGKTIVNNYFLYAIFLISFFSEIFTFSRGGYLGMAVSFLIMIFLLWKKFSRDQKVVWSVLFLCIAFFVLFFDNSAVQRFFSIFDLNEGSNVERIKNWQQGYELFSENVLTGVGIGSYSYNINPLFEYRDPVYAHNLYLDLGAEMGIFNLLSWILLFLSLFIGLLRISKNSKDDLSYFLSIGLIGSLTWFSVHGFFDTPIYAPQILSILIVVISIATLIIGCDKIRYIK